MEPEIVQDVHLEANRRSNPTANKFLQKNGQQVIPLHSVVVFLMATLASAIALELLPLAGSGFFEALQLQCILHPQMKGSSLTNVSNAEGLKFAIYGKSRTEDHLLHVLNVLQRFGYKRTSVDDEWDLLWAHEYPFLQMPQRLKNLQPHQRVNHIPGCGFITNKVDLSTTHALSFLPKSFKLPVEQDDFLRYAKENPDALFVEKNNEHRNILIKSPHEFKLNSSDTFAQEFVKNPLLVDGYKFDIGVYVLISSVNPLRIYIYAGDVLFRYCAVKYHPFDPKQLDKYVVGDDYLPTWEVPSLAKFYKKHAGSMRASFDAYMRDQSKDSSIIWTQVEDIVRQTVLAKEHDITRLLRAYKTQNFFDLMRFDMIIDDQLRVYLMEVNMSPNLSSAHFKPNSLLYEQILYNSFNLLGIGSPVRRSSLRESNDEIEEMITADKNLATNINLCVEYDCDKSCNLDVCKLCLSCLSGTEYTTLERAHREHLQRSDMRRIFPKPIHKPESYDIETEVQNLSEKNAWLTRWFHGKCLYDRSWCL